MKRGMIMFKLKFGIIWTLFVSIVFGIVLFIPASKRGGDEISPGMILFLMLFEAIGIWMLVGGTKQIITDKKTDKYGSLAYGRIVGIRRTGAYVNGVPELEAVIATYIPEENKVKLFSEIIGIGNLNYRPGMYLLLKHFESDVNIVQTLQEKSIPFDALDSITKMVNKIQESFSKGIIPSAAEMSNSHYQSDLNRFEDNNAIRY